MNTQHTPGPWRVVMSAGNVDSRVNAYQIKYGRPGNPLCIVDGLGNSALNNEANARLISAAPALLNVLQEIVATIDFERGTPETEDAERLLIATRAAIAKATGEA